MTMTTPVEAEPISVYEAIGGRAALTAAVDDFYGRLLADRVLGPLFPRGATAIHRAFVITILGEALGGPERYRGPVMTEERGSHSPSRASHPGTGPRGKTACERRSCADSVHTGPG